jgi:hypothetical protein
MLISIAICVIWQNWGNETNAGYKISCFYYIWGKTEAIKGSNK